jgi:hypothetical protein
MFKSLSQLELRDSFIDLSKGIGDKQHKSRAIAVQKHLNKVLPNTKPFVIPASALSVVINSNCIVKFYSTQSDSLMRDKYTPHVFKKGNVWVYSLFTIGHNSRDLSTRKLKTAVKMVRNGIYKVIKPSEYVKLGDFAASAYLRYPKFLTIHDIDTKGNGVGKCGKVLATKASLKFLSLVDYK